MLREKVGEFLLGIGLRGVLGILVIHFINLFSISNGFPAVVGINFVTIPVVAALGMPGLGALYILGIFW